VVAGEFDNQNHRVAEPREGGYQIPTIAAGEGITRTILLLVTCEENNHKHFIVVAVHGLTRTVLPYYCIIVVEERNNQNQTKIEG
jgi:hypothetical protein